ncbi:MAG: hypothetical protein IPK83_08230 [Planctomycetes bacterium]|nr:hypothetical protein [Planctomycetota bacterium]
MALAYTLDLSHDRFDWQTARTEISSLAGVSLPEPRDWTNDPLPGPSVLAYMRQGLANNVDEIKPSFPWIVDYIAALDVCINSGEGWIDLFEPPISERPAGA